MNFTSVSSAAIAACVGLSLSTVAFGQERLIAVDSSRALSEINPATGVRTQIGTVSANAGTCGGLAHNCQTNTLWLTSTSNDSLYTLDVATGTATLVGTYDGSTTSPIVMHGLEWDSTTGTLWASSSHNGGLYSVNTSTGVATLVGLTGLSSFTNLVHDPVANKLYATNGSTDSFYEIDRTTGAATLIGTLLGPTNPHGLAFNRSNNTIYLVCSNTDTLYRINPATGAAAAIGSVGTSNLLGLAWVAPCGPTACTPSDVAGPNQTVGPDGVLTADDIIVFLGWFFATDTRADVAGANQSTTPDSQFTADDIIVFLGRYFEGCGG
ncbi:MAG: hypothetical protein MUE97_00655 [Phycisphaerales bacterium]|nr:hypothetical protein [Phycisphaerales bacterium]